MKPKVFESKINIDFYTILFTIWFVFLLAITLFLSFNVMTDLSRFDEFFIVLVLLFIAVFFAFKYLKYLYFAKDILTIYDDRIVIEKQQKILFKAKEIVFEDIFKVTYKMYRNYRAPFNVYGKIRIKCFGEVIEFGQDLNEYDSVQLMKNIVSEFKIRGFEVKTMTTKKNEKHNRKDRNRRFNH